MSNASDALLIDAAARRLIDGGLVAFATETVYGLGADATQRDAVAAIYATKGRPADHPLIVHVNSVDEARWWALWPGRAERLAHQFWPGPLTMIVARRAEVPAWACAGEATIGLRCPSHPLARALLARFAALGGRGVAAPSANRFGRISPTSAQHVREDLSDALADGSVQVLDGGDAIVGLESTIVDLSRERAVLLRPGAISAAALAQALGEPIDISTNIIDPMTVDPAAPRASGTLAAHYAPLTPLALIDAKQVFATIEQAYRRNERLALFAPASALDALPRLSACAGDDATPARRQPGVGYIELAPDSPDAYGQTLYATLRRLDAAQPDRIIVQAPPRCIAWQAVWDRLLRAARGSGADGSADATGAAQQPD